MRVLFLSRASLFTNRGGDTTQIEQTATALRSAGVEVTIATTDQKIDYNKFDLLHFFNIIRPADILVHVQDSGLPFVVSTIYVDYSQLPGSGWKGAIISLLGKQRVEYIKNIARFFLNGEKIQWLPYWWKGQRKSIRKVLSLASYLLPNSQSEYERLKIDFPDAGKYVIVPNGVNLTMFDSSKFPEDQRIQNKVLCVARVEPIKNQYRLIEALNNTAFELYLVGKPSTNHYEYFEQCKKIAADNIHFIDGLPQQELLPLYASAKVHILPSWFETTGLSSLEAAAMGCNIVVTDKGDTKDYFGEMAVYCDPSLSESILSAVRNAAMAPPQQKLKQKILDEYNWNNAAKITLEVYKKVLSTRI